MRCALFNYSMMGVVQACETSENDLMGENATEDHVGLFLNGKFNSMFRDDFYLTFKRNPFVVL